MNSNSLVYASSLFSLAKDEGKVDAVMQDLLTASVCFCEAEQYSALLDSPVVPLSERLALIDEAFSVLDEYVINFIKLLCEKKLTYGFTDCVKQYEKLYNKENNIEKVTVITATPLREELKIKLLEKLERSFQKTIVAHYKVDKAILGGIVVQTENSQTDASVKARLDAIKAQISNN